MSHINPADLIAYGPDANCVPDHSSPYYCPVSDSVYGYFPALGASITFLILFAIALALHLYQGLRHRTWWFMGSMIIGCVCEILGYGGRILLWQDPFSFNGFMLQITMITLGPAFFSAAIYFTLSKIVVYLGREYSRLTPRAYYWIFIPCDLISLSLQGSGGGLSNSSDGSSQIGVDVAVAGLSFQVLTLCIFIALAVDFTVRFVKGRKRSGTKDRLPTQFRIFVAFLSLAIVLILIRCIYRIDELSDGYSGPLIHNQGLFIGLEGVMIIIAAFCPNLAHPGPVFAVGRKAEREGQRVDSESGIIEEGKL